MNTMNLTGIAAALALAGVVPACAPGAEAPASSPTAAGAAPTIRVPAAPAATATSAAAPTTDANGGKSGPPTAPDSAAANGGAGAATLPRAGSGAISGQPAPTPATSVAATKPVDLELASVGNQMKFDKTRLTVKTGTVVHLTYHNNATLAVLPHNWVLVKPGTQARVARAELAHYADGYAAPDPDILAHTPLAAAGKSVWVTFTAPAPGTYPYICTVPGHYMVEHGQLVVTP